jgi:hypothetical protein
MPIAQLGGNPRESGRDHNPRGFSHWMAGGGMKSGLTYGTTDDLGYEAVDNKVSVTVIAITVATCKTVKITARVCCSA